MEGCGDPFPFICVSIRNLPIVFACDTIKASIADFCVVGGNSMRLFHVSEEPNITVFEPRLPKRKDLDPSVGLVWAINESCLPNFLTPRDCPRVAYHASENTTEADRKRFFSSALVDHTVVIESAWYRRIQETTLYIYEFETDAFELLDQVAGYYVAKTTQYPKAKYVVTDLLGELLKRNVEVRFVDNLWQIADAVKASSLNWSLCRMANALLRE